ncbi:MAG: hypothetical protein WBB18_09555 [Nodosilinea sp.]
MTDDDIDTSDSPPLGKEFFAKATMRMPRSKVSVVAVPVDAETLGWFQDQGEGAERHMAAALKIYAEAQKQAATLHAAR